MDMPLRNSILHIDGSNSVCEGILEKMHNENRGSRAMKPETFHKANCYNEPRELQSATRTQGIHHEVACFLKKESVISLFMVSTAGSTSCVCFNDNRCSLFGARRDVAPYYRCEKFGCSTG